MKKEKNFVDFVVAARKNPKLANEFLTIKSKRKLKAFFHAKGYKGISQEDCDKLVDVSQNIDPVGPERGPFVYMKL